MIHNDEIRIKCVGNFLSYVDAQLQGMCVAQGCLIHSEVIIATGVALRLGRAVRPSCHPDSTQSFAPKLPKFPNPPASLLPPPPRPAMLEGGRSMDLLVLKASRAASCFCVAIA